MSLLHNAILVLSFEVPRVNVQGSTLSYELDRAQYSKRNPRSSGATPTDIIS